MSNLTFGGPLHADPAVGAEPYAYYETIAGGAGAGPEGDGAHVVQTHMTNTRNTPIEALELIYPVRVLACGVRRRSGGEGRKRGGDGVLKRLLFLEPARVSFVGERQARGPWGLAGGKPGQPGSVRLRAPGARGWRRLGSRMARTVAAGSELEVRTPGGGGYGRYEDAD